MVDPEDAKGFGVRGLEVEEVELPWRSGEVERGGREMGDVVLDELVWIVNLRVQSWRENVVV